MAQRIYTIKSGLKPELMAASAQPASVGTAGGVGDVAPYNANTAGVPTANVAEVASAGQTAGRVYRKKNSLTMNDASQVGQIAKRTYAPKSAVAAEKIKYQTQSVRDWFEEAEAVAKDTTEYVSNNQGKWNAEYGSDCTERVGNLLASADDVASYIDYYLKEDEETYKATSDAFSQFKTYLADFDNYAAQMREDLGQYKSEEEYQKALAAAKEFEDLLAVDTEDLENKIQLYSGILDMIAEHQEWQRMDVPNGYNLTEVRSHLRDLESKLNYYGFPLYDPYGTPLSPEKEIEASLNEAKELRDKAKQAQVQNTVANAKDDENFDDYVKDGKSKDNPILDNYDKIAAEMTQEQKNNYYYLRGKFGQEDAEIYFELVRDSIKAQHATHFYETYMKDKWYEGAFNVVQGLDSVSTGVQNIFGNHYTDDRLFDPQLVGSLVRENLSDTDLLYYDFKEGKWKEQKIFGSSLGQSLYDAGMSITAQLPAIGVGAASNLLIPGAGAYVTPTLMGVTAAGNSYKEALDMGYTPQQAREYALINGVSEIVMEKVLNGIGIAGDSVVGGVITKATAGIKNATIKGLVQFGGKMLSEGAEEWLQEVLTPIYENIALDADNTWDDIDWEAAAYAGLMGAASAGVFEGAGAATSVVTKNIEYRKIGAEFVKGENGLTIDKAIEIGLSNAKGTDTYKAAVKIQERAQAGERVSAYTVGRMVVESQTEQAQVSKAIERAVLSSAKEMNIPTDAAETVSIAAVALGQKVEFVSPDRMHNRYMAGEYDAGTDTVRLNAAELDTDKLIGAILAHEMTHAAEGTSQLRALERTVKRIVGAEHWNNLKEGTRQAYAARGVELDDDGTREALAHWVEENLFKNKAFAKAVVDGDANAGNAFFYMIDRVRRALGAKKASAGNLAMLERLFMQAIDARTHGPREGDVQGAIVALKDGKIYVQADRKVLTGTDKEAWKTQIDAFFDNVLLQNGSLTVESVEGDELTITKDETVWKGKDEHVLINQQKTKLSKGQYFVKLTALSHIDELAEASVVQRNKDGTRNIEPDTKNHPFARDGFEYRTVYFQDFDGKYYRITLSVGLADGVATVYNIGKMKEAASPGGDVISAIGSKALGVTATDTNVAQNATDVNTQSMQEGAGISAQGALLSPESMEAVRNGTWREARARQNAEGESPRLPDGQTPPFRQGGQTPSVADGDTSLGEGGFEAVQVDDAAVLESAVRSQLQGKKVVDVDTSAIKHSKHAKRYLDTLERELGTPELVRRMFNATQIERPAGTVEIDGQQVDANAYVDTYEDTLPNDAEALEQHLHRLEAENGAVKEQMYLDGTLEDYHFGTLKIDLQLFAAKRKLEFLQLAAGENGKKMRQFYEKRLLGNDENHCQELINLLAGRPETYNPIANQKTLAKAKENLKDKEYKSELRKRLYAYNKHDLFDSEEVAAASLMINDAINQMDHEEAANLVIGLSRKGTEAGRAVQAFSMMGRLTPEGVLKTAARYYAKDVDRIVGAGADADFDKLAKEILVAIEEAEEEGLSSDEIAERIRNGEGRGVEGAAPYGANSSADIHNMLEKIRRGDFRQNDKVEFGRVPDAIVKRLQEVTGTDVTGYKMVVEARILDHLLRDHGVTGAANQSLADDADIARMGDILANPDDIRKGDPTKTYTHQKNGKMKPSPTVIYEKGEGDKSYYVIHTIADSKKKTLYVTTAFIGQPGYKKGAQQSSDGNTPGDTVKTELAGTPTDIIARDEGQVKAEVKMSREELVEALTDDLAAEEGAYLTRDAMGDIIKRAVNECADLHDQVKRYVLKEIRKDDGALAQRIYEVYKRGDLNRAKMKRAMEEALGLPTLTAEDVKYIVEQTAKIQKLEDKPVERADAIDDLYDYLGAKLSVSFGEKMAAWRKFAMLFNIRTHARNFFANLAYVGVRNVDSAIATGLELMAVKLNWMKPKERAAAFGWRCTAHGQQILETIKERVPEAVLEMTGRGAKYEETSNPLMRHRKKHYTKWVEALDDFNSSLLEREDVFFFKAAYTNALGQVMTARKATEVTDEMHAIAMKRALEATFRNKNVLSRVLSVPKRGLTSADWKIRQLAQVYDVVLPFVNTPAAIMEQTAMHSPIGLAVGFADLIGKALGKSDKAAADIINDFAKGIHGSALFYLGIMAVQWGILRIAYRSGDKDKAADEMEGRMENAIIIGDTAISIDWLQPPAAPLIMGGAVAEALADQDDDTLDSIFGVGLSAANSLLSLSMLQSFYDAVGSYGGDAATSLSTIAENAVSQGVPTLLGQVARILDPVQRKVQDGTLTGSLLNPILAKIPLATRLLDPELDVWGNEVYRTGAADGAGIGFNIAQQLAVPWNTKRGTAQDDPISAELLRLYHEHDDGAALPTAVTRNEAKAEGEDWTRLNQLLGGVNRLAVEEFINNEKAYEIYVDTGELTDRGNPKQKKVTKYYRDMTDEERINVLENHIYAKAKKEVLGKTDHIPEEHLNDSERYIRDLLRRVREGERGTYDGDPVESSATTENNDYYKDLLRRMRNGN